MFNIASIFYEDNYILHNLEPVVVMSRYVLLFLFHDNL